MTFYNARHLPHTADIEKTRVRELSRPRPSLYGTVCLQSNSISEPVLIPCAPADRGNSGSRNPSICDTRSSCNTQEPRGLQLVSIEFCNGIQNRLPFQFRHGNDLILAVSVAIGGCCRLRPGDGRRQVRHLDHWSAGKGASPLQQFSSSRTLPGQSCASISFKARHSGFFPARMRESPAP